MVAIILVFIVLLIAAGLPLFAGLGAITLLLYFSAEGLDGWLMAIIDPLARVTGGDLLLPIPLFTVMGYIIAASNAPQRILKVTGFIVQKLTGRGAFTFGVLALLVSALLTPLTGASGITIVALGGVLFPVLINAGYSQRSTLGIITSGGSLGLLFFPSIPVILYSIVSANKAPVKELFLAGVVPGLLFILLPVFYVVFTSRGLSIPKEQNYGFGAIKDDIWRLFLEVLIVPLVVVLFFNGTITIGEIGMIILLYFFVLEVIVFKEIGFADLPEVLKEGIVVSGGVIVIVFFAVSFNSYLIDQEFPQMMFEWISGFIESKYLFLVLLNIFLLLVGALMDIFSAIIVIAPLVIPVAELYGINMLHLGVLFLTNLEIGYITPPVGMNLFLSSFRFNVPASQLYRAVFPYLLVMLFAQVLVTYLPAISTWLPGLF